MEQVCLHYLVTTTIALNGHRAVVDSNSTAVTRFGFGFFRLIFAASLFLGLYIHFTSKDRFEGVPFLVGVGLIGVFVPPAFHASVRWRIRRKVAKMPEKDRWISWVVSPDDVEMRDNLSEIRVKWAAFTRVIERAEGFLFLIALNRGWWLPATAFGTGVEARFVSDWARRRVKNYQIREDVLVLGKGGPHSLDEL